MTVSDLAALDVAGDGVCQACRHLVAAHHWSPMPAGVGPPPADARPVCNACRTSTPPRECPATEAVRGAA